MQRKHQYHAVLIADSRARGFSEYDQGKLYTYTTHYVIKPGATIQRLKDDALALIQSIPSTDTTLIVVIAAGINNLTNKIDKDHGYEISPSTATASQITTALLDLKWEIKDARPSALVTFATIPPVNFLLQLKYWQSRDCIQTPIHPESDRLEFQKSHETIINDINSRICEINYNEQSGIHCQTTSWHSAVLRRQRGKNRLIVSALSDGIHGTEEVKRKWHQGFHQAVQKDIALLQAKQ